MANLGKILIIKLYNKLLSMLVRDNEIVTVSAQREDAFLVGNIYIGKVQSIAKNIGAVFVDLGEGYLTFLSMMEAKEAIVTNRKPDGTLKQGDEVLVQLEKLPIKTKLAGVTTRISLSGSYVVVGMGEKAIHSSAKLGKRYQSRFRELEELKKIATQYRIILRTNAGNLKADEPLIEEAQVLAKNLQHIIDIADTRTCYSCLHRVNPDYVNFVQNAYQTEYDEVVTDLPEVYEKLNTVFAQMPIKIRFYQDDMLPLYKLYSIETRVKELLDKKVWLKSGGYLIIEPTEALISIDVNSGKYEKGTNLEETSFKINMEAAEVIAKQLRARNLSGMILVDFINMKQKEQETILMDHMKVCLRRDSVTADVVDMTALGLMELTRRKIKPCFADQMKA